MQLAALFEHQAWSTVQLYWEALVALPDFVSQQPQFDWDFLRVLLDRKLNSLQRLTLAQIITPEEAQIIQSLCLQRFDQVLEQLNRRRQRSHAFYAATTEPASPHLRYQILQEVEQQLKRLRKEPLMREKLDPLTCQHILEDLNLELLEKIAKQLAPQEKPLLWPLFKQGIVCLSCNQITPESALEALILYMQEESAQEIAQRVLQSSSFFQSLESALKILQRSPFPPELASHLERRILQEDLPVNTRKLAIEMLEMLTTDKALALLKQLIEMPTLPEALRDLILELLTVYSETKHPLIPELLKRLQRAIEGEEWAPLSLLKAIQILVKFRVFIGFEHAIIALQTALARDYSELEEAAIQTLVVLKDQRAIPFLMDALNRKRQQKDTPIERYGRAFLQEQQPLETKLVWALKQFGVQLELNPLSQKWQRKRA